MSCSPPRPGRIPRPKEMTNVGRTIATRRRKASGFVLVLALAALALIMVLLLAFFAGTSHQLRGAQNDATYAREKMLADSAVALVMGQIQVASNQTGQTWISQPGLLRTYDTTSSRKPTACYKLYSAAQMMGYQRHARFPWRRRSRGLEFSGQPESLHRSQHAAADARPLRSVDLSHSRSGGP